VIVAPSYKDAIRMPIVRVRVAQKRVVFAEMDSASLLNVLGISIVKVVIIAATISVYRLGQIGVLPMKTVPKVKNATPIPDSVAVPAMTIVHPGWSVISSPRSARTNPNAIHNNAPMSASVAISTMDKVNAAISKDVSNTTTAAKVPKILVSNP
jgi:hypothetical protein